MSSLIFVAPSKGLIFPDLNFLSKNSLDKSVFRVTILNFYDLFFHSFLRGTRTASININSGFLNRLKSKASKTPTVFSPFMPKFCKGNGPISHLKTFIIKKKFK